MAGLSFRFIHTFWCKMEQQQSNEKKVFGLEDNIAGAIAYLGGFITGLIFYISVEENKFVRFHAFQSILISIPLFILSFIWSAIWSTLPYIYRVSYWISNLFWFLTWILFLFLMSKAYKGIKYKLPVVGNIAEKNE